MTDGSVGDNTQVETRIRVISGDPNASLYLKHVLSPTPTKIENFDHKVVVYHAPTFQLPNPEAYGMTSQGPFVLQMLLKGSVALSNTNSERTEQLTEEEKKQIADQVAGIVLVCGTNSLSVLNNAITEMTDYFHINNLQLPLHASIVNEGKNNVLVFDPTGNLFNGYNKNLTSTEHCIWTQKGLTRSFVGLSHGDASAARPRGSLVSYHGTKQRVTVPALAAPHGHPSHVVFLVDDKSLSTVSVLSEKAATSFFLKYGGNNLSPLFSEQAEKGFVQLLQETKAKVFAVNTNGLQSTSRDQIISALSAATNIASANENKEGISQVSSLPGYNGPLSTQK